MYKGITNAPDILYEMRYYDVTGGLYSFMSNIDCGEQTIEVYANDVLLVSGILAKANYKDDVYESDIIATTQSAPVEAEVYKIVLAGAEHHLYHIDERIINLPPNFYCIYAEETGDGVEFRAITFAATDISVSKAITKSVKRYDTKLLPDYLLPATAARKSEVSKAAAVASAAQTTADNAQTAADNAQTAADNATTRLNSINAIIETSLAVVIDNKKATEAENTTLYAAFYPKATKIGVAAFDHCKMLSVIEFPMAQQICYRAFMKCESLKKVYFPSVTNIDGFAFKQCTSLENADFPEATRVGNGAFDECTSLKNINFPKLQSLGGFSFTGCTSLKNVELPALTTLYDGEFEECTSLSVVNLPSAISLGTDVFKGCTSLAAVELPVAASIGSACFFGCTSLAKIIFPAANSIGASAFNGCHSLSTVILSGDIVCTLGALALCGTLVDKGTGYIYVPDTLVAQYKAADGWKTYADQIKPLSEYTEG